MGEFDFRNQNINVASLPGSPSQDGTDATGVTQPTGGVGIRGWLSGIYNLFNGGSAKVNATLTGSIVTQDDEGNDVLRIADVAPWGYDPVTQSIITKNNAFSKLDIIANAISILPGNNSGLLDLGITTETEIWIEVLIDKQPWTARIYGYPHAPENGLTTGLYPKRSSYTTAHTSVELPCRSMVLGIAASVSTGLIDPASLADAQYFKTPVPGLKLHITNLHATDTATLTVRVLRFWKG